MTGLRQQITAALKDFDTYPFPEAAARLFAALGYKADHTLPNASVADFCREWDQEHILASREQEAFDQLTSPHFPFQLTGTELTMQRDMLDNGTAVDGTRICSYLFFAAELPSDLYGRSQFLAVGPSGRRDLGPSPSSGSPVWFALCVLMRVAPALAYRPESETVS
jgi:hypothetical protein